MPLYKIIWCEGYAIANPKLITFNELKEDHWNLNDATLKRISQLKLGQKIEVSDANCRFVIGVE